MSAHDVARLAAEIRTNIEQYDFSWDSHYKTFPEELATALVAAGWVGLKQYQDVVLMLHASRRLRDKLEAENVELREQLADARHWAQHGYELGQRSCSWSDQGVAPKWLTEPYDNAEVARRVGRYETPAEVTE